MLIPSACDACRARKVRCDRDPPLDPSFDVYAPGAIIPPCKHCSGLKITCSYFYQPRKRGPPNLYLKKLRGEAQQAAGGAGPVASFPGGPESTQPVAGGSNSGGSNSTTSPPIPSPSGYVPSFAYNPEQQYHQPQPHQPHPHLLHQQMQPHPYPPQHHVHYNDGGYNIDQDTSGQQLDEDDEEGGESPNGGGMHVDQSRPSWSYAPSSSTRGGGQDPYDGMPPPPQQLSMGLSSSNASRSVSFSALTLPKVSPSPPVSPSLASSSISSYPRYDLSNYSTSLSSSTSHRGMLPSILRPSPLSSPSATTNFPLHPASSAPSPFGVYTQSTHHAPSPPFFGALSSTSYERNSARWSDADPAGTGDEGVAGPSGSALMQQQSHPEIPANGIQLNLEVAPSPSSLNRVHRLEDVLPRDTAVYVVSLFFDFVWPLTPCLHQPTFLADLASHLEERNPLFFALLMSTLACTLVQVPKSYIPVESGEVRKLANRCYQASRLISIESYDPPVLEMLIIRYFDTVYHFVIGNPGSNHAAYGECQHIAISLGLHKEETYQGLDPIETEIRRRIFFLIITADKSMAALSARPIAMRPEDYYDVLPPRELDDEYITRDAYLQQPASQTAIIVGFNIISRIFAVLGEIVTLQRETRRCPPVGPEGIIKKLREVGTLMQKTVKLLVDSPPAFSMKKSFNSAANSPAAGWETEARNQLETYFFNPASSKETAKDAYLVSQGNIFITHALTRFLLLQYRDELLELSGEVGTPARTAAERVSWDSDGSSDRREAVAVDLLNVLHNIPIKNLAVNGPSLVHKVRLVASTLLDLDPDPPSVKGEQSVMRINSYLWDFLSILSDIEKNFAD
ncbi:fungal-specific transcription factor domain-containing protein [Mrakia frigida]|uniref:Zn(II)2Cys6 transcription factor n=1 Tax=Mrakia frigida TaxID=29902 RepID=UPI003FCC19FD